MLPDKVQQDWIEFAAAVRRSLHDEIELLPHYMPAIQKTFVETCNAAYWLEHNAHTFGQRVTQYNREPWEND